MAATKTLAQLNDLFKKYNQRYWNDTLPVIKIEIKEIRNTYGEYTSPDTKKEDSELSYSIAINARLHWRNGRSIRKTLLHEMCHHAVFIKNKTLFWNNKIRWHGKEWKREMERIGFKRPITRFT